MTLNLETCLRCHALVDANMRWQHDQFHHSVDGQPVLMPCHTCRAQVASTDYDAHARWHDEQYNLKVLLDRLLGDVEAHLEFLAVQDG